MTDTIAEIIEGVAEGFDELRQEFIAGSLFLLRRGDGSGTEAFTVAAEIETGWFIEYSNFRGQFELSIATIDESFRATVKKSDAAAVGGEVYEIIAGDTVPPSGGNPFWKLRCASTGERFEPA